VRYVYPDGAEPLAETWLHQIGSVLSDRSVIVTGYYPVEYGASAYIFEPLPTLEFPAWQVRYQARRDLPETMDNLYLPLEGGLRLSRVQQIGEPIAGGTFDVMLAWEIGDTPSSDVTGFVHLTGPDGAVLTGQDIPLPLEKALSGTVLIERYTLGVPADLTLSTLQVMAGAYTRTSDGSFIPLLIQGEPRAVVLPDLSVTPALPITTPNEGSLNISLGGEMILTGVMVSPEGPLTPGEEVVIDLAFFSTHPLVHDYVVKVDLIGERYAWRVSSDHIPGNGALPTLKWLSGWQITDRHRLTIPMDASVFSAHAEVVVYDHFTGTILPLLDPALAAQGQAVIVYSWP
jgi:hypothetical protein